MNRTIKLTILLFVLISASIFLALSDSSNRSNNVEADLFQISDTSQIEKITIASQKYTNVLERIDSRWRLNNAFDADPSLINIAANILSRVVVKRYVSKISNEEISDEMKRNGSLVTIHLYNDKKLEFWAGGNASKSESYFLAKDESRPHIVEIPGYNNYLSGIFELTTNQWRDRRLFSSSWRTIQLLNIDYANSNSQDLTIQFKDRFLSVKGVDEIDTTALLQYLSQYEFFQINDYLEAGKHQKYDSVRTTTAFASLKLSDIDPTRNRTLNIYPKIPGERFYLLTDESNQMMVIDEKRMENLMTSGAAFISN